MKLATVYATFPELRGGFCHRTGRGRASSSRIAIARAFADLLVQVKGRRVHEIKCSIAIIEVTPPVKAIAS